MTITSRFDCGDLFEFIDRETQEKKTYKVVCVQSWGALSGFRYVCIENGKSDLTAPISDYEYFDDMDLNTKYEVKEIESNERNDESKLNKDIADLSKELAKAFIGLSLLDSLVKDKGDDRK